MANCQTSWCRRCHRLGRYLMKQLPNFHPCKSVLIDANWCKFMQIKANSRRPVAILVLANKFVARPKSSSTFSHPTSSGWAFDHLAGADPILIRIGHPLKHPLGSGSVHRPNGWNHCHVSMDRARRIRFSRFFVQNLSSDFKIWPWIGAIVQKNPSWIMKLTRNWAKIFKWVTENWAKNG